MLPNANVWWCVLVIPVLGGLRQEDCCEIKPVWPPNSADQPRPLTKAVSTTKQKHRPSLEKGF